MLEIETTNRCNLSCPYCIKRVEKREEKDMTPSEFDHILKELLTIRPTPASRGREFFILHGHGEPLMNPHFTDIVNNPLLKKFPMVRFSTNATLLTQEKIKSIIDAGTIELINVSLQSARKEVMETLQRGANFEETVANIRNLIRYAHGKRTYVRIQQLKTTLNSNETRADYEKLLEVKNFLFWSRNLTYTTQSTQLPEEVRHLIIRQKNSRFFPRLRVSACWKNGKYVYGDSVIVNVHGNLTGCCWDSSNLQTYGNVFEKPLSELRSGGLLKTLRRELVNKDFHRLPICKRCVTRLPVTTPTTESRGLPASSLSPRDSSLVGAG